MSEFALKLIAENRRTKSRTLDLSNCDMAVIPPGLTQLFWLEELVIGGIAYYDYEKKQDIFIVNKGGNNTFSRLPNGIENLSALKKW